MHAREDGDHWEHALLNAVRGSESDCLGSMLWWRGQKHPECGVGSWNDLFCEIVGMASTTSILLLEGVHINILTEAELGIEYEQGHTIQVHIV